MKLIWPWLQKIFLVIFTLHIGWFIFFVFTNFSEAVAINDFKWQLLFLLIVILISAIIYFVWLRKRKIIKIVTRFVWKFLFTGYIVFIFYFLLNYIFNPPITFTQMVNLAQGNGLNRDYVSYANMGSNIKLAVISSEDQLYLDHDGFDLKAIKRAIKYNAKHPEKVKGASTISQQTAKNIFLWQGRDKFRKGLEVFFTFTIESGYSKRLILERYLNIAEMGKGIFGIQAAAKVYFNKDAKNLTRIEAAQIAACLPNPKFYLVKPLSRFVSNRANSIMRQMNNLEKDVDIAALIK